ncbi:MAG: hypothetical protein KF841_10520 [Phycisphaerae bacterium]|nr:hypothetical protein [Phycisphaerae bacterium]
MSKSITVHTNVPGPDAQVILTFKGEIWQPIQPSAPAVAFGRITPADLANPGKQAITLTNRTGGPIQFSEPKVSVTGFSAAIAPIEGTDNYELTVTVVPPLKPGNNSGWIEMQTGIADPPTVRIPINAFVTAAIDVMPPSLVLPPSRVVDLSRQFYVRTNVNRSFKITRLSSSNPQIAVQSTEQAEGKSYQITLTIPAQYAPSDDAGDLVTIETDDPEAPSLNIPITVAAARKQPANAAIHGAAGSPAAVAPKPNPGVQTPIGPAKTPS